MNSISLYNFDHNIRHATSFCIDAFKITVTEQHCNNLNNLHRYTSIQFGDEIQRTTSIIGSHQETAMVEYDESNVSKSSIYPSSSDTNIDDLCALLSFITGRSVFRGDKISADSPLSYNTTVVDSLFFQRPQNLSLSSLGKIASDRLSIPFLNILESSKQPYLLTKAFYSNSIFNAIYENWAATNNATRYITFESKIDEIISSALDNCKQSISQKISDANIASDICARININRSPSAIFKITKFLEAMGLIQVNPKKDVIKKIRSFNTLRNVITHQGSIPSPKSLGFTTAISDEHLVEISANITNIMHTINTWFFASTYLNLPSSFTDTDKDDIIRFFDSGIFRMQDVFQETYEAFIERLETTWKNLS